MSYAFPLNHNNPPDPTPFEISRDEIEGLYTEAGHWLDGSGVKTQEDADAVSLLIDELRKAEKRADERRVAENKPFDDGKAEVQARYAPLIGNTKAGKGKAILALEVCKQALKPFLDRLDAEKRAKAEAARKEADEKARAAQEAMRQTRVDDLQARAEAEALLSAAKKAEAAATHAENDKAHVKGGSRAIGLRTTYKHEITDVRAFAAYAWKAHYDELCDFLDGLARKQVAAGHHAMPGVLVTELKTL